MATVMNSFGQYMNQTSQHQMLAASAGFSASQMTSQNMIPRIPDSGYRSNQPYPQAPSLYPLHGQSESLKAPPPLGQHYYVDQMMNPHPYSSLYHGLDINAIRRKNATRETTGPLKAWLKAHRKNPYPTKGEKVMLAIATRMTLTQVSTWFANARRRMKKDKIDDEDEDGQESLPDITQPEKRERSGSMSSSMSHYSASEADTSKDLSDISDIDVDDSISRKRPAKKCVQRLFSPDPRTDNMLDPSSSPESIVSDRLSSEMVRESRLPAVSEVMPNFMGTMKLPLSTTSYSTSRDTQKPKIWSISEIIGSATSTLETGSAPTSVPYNYNSVPSYSDYFAMGYTYPTIDSTALSAYEYHSKQMDNASYSHSSLQFL